MAGTLLLSLLLYGIKGPVNPRDSLVSSPGVVVATFRPASTLSRRATAEDSRFPNEAKADRKGSFRQDRADFDDRSTINLRADPGLPSRDHQVRGGGVFWPASTDSRARIVTMTLVVASSDHRLVSLDLAIDEETRTK